VRGLEQEFPGKVTAQNIDATEPGARAAIKDVGFISHGLVVRSAEGAVLWKQADHTVRIDEVRDAVGRILGG